MTVPRSVAILGMGPSLQTYVRLATKAGDRRMVADETWCVNATAGTLAYDRIFHMDDMRLQERRAEAAPDSNVAGMLRWLRTHAGPIYTSRVYPEYPGAVEYPLAEVLGRFPHPRFTSTPPYAVALAVAIGVAEIQLYGLDYDYSDSGKVEKGRACTEFWLGVAMARGVRVKVAEDSTLLDTDASPESRFYGFDADRVTIHFGSDGCRVEREPRDLPSVDEIEARYSHEPHRPELVA